MKRLPPLAALLLGVALGCAREEEVGEVDARDTLDAGEIVQPPSAGAPRLAEGAGAPDTVVPEAAAPVDTTVVVPGPTVGPVPPPRLDLGVIVGVYRRNYEELFAEFGSEVRNDVDPELVEEAKRITALEHGFVERGAWNQMVSQLTSAQRGELAERIAVTNQELARQLHMGPPLPTG